MQPPLGSFGNSGFCQCGGFFECACEAAQVAFVCKALGDRKHGFCSAPFCVSHFKLVFFQSHIITFEFAQFSGRMPMSALCRN